MPRKKKPTKAERQRQEIAESIAETIAQDEAIRQRKRAEWLAAYPPDFLYTRDVMGIRFTKDGKLKTRGRPEGSKALEELVRQARDILTEGKTIDIEPLADRLFISDGAVRQRMRRIPITLEELTEKARNT